MKIIDKESVVSHILYRQHCLYVDENYLKDLKSLNRDLVREYFEFYIQKKTVIIDNSLYAFAYQLDNGIPISSYFDNKKDEELKNMIPLLQRIVHMKDVRRFLRNHFKLREKVRNFVLPFSSVCNNHSKKSKTTHTEGSDLEVGDMSQYTSHIVLLCIQSTSQ